jgi:hypothetical protein
VDANEEVPVVGGGGVEEGEEEEGRGEDFVSTGKVNELLSRKNSPLRSRRVSLR